MNFRSESTEKLKKTLMRVAEDPSSLDSIEWLLHLIPRDLTNALYIQSHTNYKRNFEKLGGISWYFTAAFDESYEADGYDVNTDEIVPVLDTIITDSEEWAPSSQFSEHLKSTTPTRSNHRTERLPSEIELTLDSLESYPASNIDLIHESVRKEIEHSETLDRIIIFFGLPSRKVKTEIHYNSEYEYHSTYFNDKEIETFYTIWPSQLLKNMIGGWDSPSVISTDKQILQWIFLCVKIPLILPIKLLTLLPKLFLNCNKLFTEFFPLVAKRFSAHAFAWMFLKFLDTKYHKFIGSSKPSKTTNGLYYLYKFLMVIGINSIVFAYFVFRSTAIIGRAITSPLKSVKMAFRYGRMLQISVFGQPTTFIISLLMGTIGLCLSLSITITAWSIIFPLIFGALSAYSIDIARLMLVVVAKLTSVLNSFSLGHALIVLIQSTYATLGQFLLVTFGSVISNAATYLFGVKLSTSFIIQFSFIGAISAFIAPALSQVADGLSNLWVTWKGRGLFTNLVEFFQREIETTKIDDNSTLQQSPTSPKKQQEIKKDTISTGNHQYSQDESSEPSDFGVPSQKVVEFTQSTRRAIMSSEDDSLGFKLLEELASKGRGDDSSDSSSHPPRYSPQDHFAGMDKHGISISK